MFDSKTTRGLTPRHFELEEEVDRDTLTRTLFRCIDNCDNPDEINDLRAQIVAVNVPVADSLAHRYFGHGEHNDDLKQVAYLGLTKAAAGYESSRGKGFLAYAVPTITGELKKHFRDRCWAVRPPRRIQDLQREITIACDELRQETGHQPSASQISSRLDVPVETVTEAMAAQGCFHPTSLDAPLAGESPRAVIDTLCDEDVEFARSEGHVLIEQLVKDLSDDDREILALRFIDDLTQEQIATRLHTTQMQVSRRLSRLMAHLRQRAQGDVRRVA